MSPATTAATTTTIDPSTLAASPFRAAELWGEQPALRSMRDGEWHDQSFSEVAEEIRRLGQGFIELGLEHGDRVSIFSESRPEWALTAMAVLSVGGVVTAIYPTNSPKEVAWVLSDSGSKFLVCENDDLAARARSVADQTPALQRTFLIDAPADVSTPTLADVESAGRHRDAGEVDRRAAAVRPEDLAALIYTSGTTGPAKGCMLTHQNLVAPNTAANERLDGRFLEPGDVVYMFLPLAHLFGQGMVHWSMLSGSTVAYASAGAAGIMSDLQTLNPTVMPSVPRIYEKIYAALTSQVPHEMVEQAVGLGLTKRALEAAGKPVPAEMQSAFEQADAALFAKVRAIFGGRARYALTGAAPLASEIMDLFWAAGVPVIEAWGMTESSAVGTINTLAAFKSGTVGQPSCELRIAEDGEILLRGDIVMAGYWNNPAATAETIVDGWLHTGDLGSQDEDGYVTITGRKKDIIITAAGKNLSPANLENGLQQSPWIANAVMLGDRRPFPVALVTLDPETVLPWAEENSLPADLTKLADEPAVRALVQEALDEVNAHHAKVAQIKKFVILDHPFSIETGELTPTLKVKRNVVAQKFEDVVESMYAAKS